MWGMQHVPSTLSRRSRRSKRNIRRKRSRPRCIASSPDAFIVMSSIGSDAGMSIQNQPERSDRGQPGSNRWVSVTFRVSDAIAALIPLKHQPRSSEPSARREAAKPQAALRTRRCGECHVRFSGSGSMRCGGSHLAMIREWAITHLSSTLYEVLKLHVGCRVVTQSGVRVVVVVKQGGWW